MPWSEQEVIERLSGTQVPELQVAPDELVAIGGRRVRRSRLVRGAAAVTTALIVATGTWWVADLPADGASSVTVAAGGGAPRWTQEADVSVAVAPPNTSQAGLLGAVISRQVGDEHFTVTAHGEIVPRVADGILGGADVFSDGRQTMLVAAATTFGTQSWVALSDKPQGAARQSWKVVEPDNGDPLLVGLFEPSVAASDVIDIIRLEDDVVTADSGRTVLQATLSKNGREIEVFTVPEAGLWGTVEDGRLHVNHYEPSDLAFLIDGVSGWQSPWYRGSTWFETHVVLLPPGAVAARIRIPADAAVGSPDILESGPVVRLGDASVALLMVDEEERSPGPPRGQTLPDTDVQWQDSSGVWHSRRS